MNELAKIEVTEDLLQLYLKTLPNTLTEGEKIQFMEVAASMQLNPFKREIYIVAFGDGDKRQFSLITGYEVYLKRADAIGRNKGWKVWTTGELKPGTVVKKYKDKNGSWYEKKQDIWEGDLKAHAKINIQGWDHPFTWDVEFSEYNQKNTMWFEKPKTMIKKVVIGQAFRLAFPSEMGSLPYMAEEIKTTEAEVIETKINSISGVEKNVQACLTESSNEAVKAEVVDEIMEAKQAGVATEDFWKRMLKKLTDAEN